LGTTIVQEDTSPPHQCTDVLRVMMVSTVDLGSASSVPTVLG